VTSPPVPRAPHRADRPLRVVYFGTYDRGVGRNAILIAGLRAVGVDVVECHTPLWRDTNAKLAAARLGTSVPRAAARLALAWVRLVARHRALGPYDVMVVGSTAHLDLPLARRLSAARGRPLVFDPLVSVAETVRDRGLVADPSRRLRALGAVERALLALPDRILVDTAAHGEAFERTLGVAPGRRLVVPAGAPVVYRDLASPYVPSDPGRPLSVVYFGQYIPLHGIDVVLRAAYELRDRRDIAFDLVGQGQMLPAARALAARLGLPNVHFHDTWLGAEELARTHLARAGICLGIFGAQPKADRVVPFKVYTALAAGRPVITGDTTAVRSLLHPGREVHVVPPADPHALAAAIAALVDDPDLRAALAVGGQAAFDARFAPDVLGSTLRAALAELAARPPVSVPPPTGPRHAWRTAYLARNVARTSRSGIVLDAGCGDGSLALQLAVGGRTVAACDRDDVRLRRARDRVRAAGVAERVHLVRADVTALPWPDGAFGGVAAGEVLEHVSDDAQAVAEMARVLASGGALVATVPAGPGRFGEVDRLVGHVRRYDRARLRRLAEDAGLRSVRIVGWGLPFGRLYDRWVQRSALLARGRTRGVVGRLGGMGWIRSAWLRAFALDERVDAGDSGSGLLLVAWKGRGGQPRPTSSPSLVDPVGQGPGGASGAQTSRKPRS
jgi:glycosyltransferase involved in cell wall biosynthesis